MGLLDVLNGMQNGPRGPSTPSAQSGSGMSPMTMAILGLLAWKAIKHFNQPGASPAQAPAPSTAGTGGLGDVLKGGLGGLLAGGAAGSVLSGGLGDLLKQFQQNGHGEAANSWVSPGPNKPISTGDLANALGADQINALSAQSGLSRDDLQKLAADKRNARSWGTAQMVALLERGEKLPAHYSCPLSVWQFGRDLTLVGLSGEVVVDYVPLLEKALGPNQLWIAAYCHGVFGYLPSAHVLAEGGYETRGLYSGGAGFFAPEAQDVVISTIRDLAKKVGRDVP